MKTQKCCLSRSLQFVAITLGALAWCSLAFCGEIHDAANSGDLEKLTALLNDNPDLVFSKDNNGQTPLHWAVYRGHKNVVELLLARKAEVNAKNNNGQTPLWVAAHEGYKDVAELLRQHGGQDAATTNTHTQADASAYTIVAKGKGVEVTRAQLEEQVMRLKVGASGRGQTMPPENMPQLNRQVLDQLIHMQLLVAKATAADKAAGKALAEKRFEEAQTKLGSEEALNRQLKLLGLTQEETLAKWTESATAETVLNRELKVNTMEGLTQQEAQKNQFPDYIAKLKKEAGVKIDDEALRKIETNSKQQVTSATAAKGLGESGALRAKAQVPSISIQNGRTFLAGQMNIGGDVQSFTNKAFACTMVQPLAKGDVIAAQVSSDQAWGYSKTSLPLGEGKTVQLPMLVMVKSSDGEMRSLFPAVVRPKADIKAGKTSLEDYQIESKRAVKEGEAIGALLVGESVISFEPVDESSKGGDLKPWFAAFKKGSTAKE